MAATWSRGLSSMARAEVCQRFFHSTLAPLDEADAGDNDCRVVGQTLLPQPRTPPAPSRTRGIPSSGRTLWPGSPRATPATGAPPSRSPPAPLRAARASGLYATSTGCNTCGRGLRTLRRTPGRVRPHVRTSPQRRDCPSSARYARRSRGPADKLRMPRGCPSDGPPAAAVRRASTGRGVRRRSGRWTSAWMSKMLPALNSRS